MNKRQQEIQEGCHSVATVGSNRPTDIAWRGQSCEVVTNNLSIYSARQINTTGC